LNGTNVFATDDLANAHNATDFDRGATHEVAEDAGSVHTANLSQVDRRWARVECDGVIAVYAQGTAGDWRQEESAAQVG
jgi:hypothetical protein